MKKRLLKLITYTFNSQNEFDITNYSVIIEGTNLHSVAFDTISLKIFISEFKINISTSKHFNEHKPCLIFYL